MLRVISKLFFLLLGPFSLLALSYPCLATNVYDTRESSSWNLRIDGPSSIGTWELTYPHYNIFPDFDLNGKNDLVVCAPYTDYQSRTNSGSCYIILDSLVENYLQIGSTLDLGNTASFNIRFDGPVAGGWLGYQAGMEVADLDNNGLNDLMLPLSGGNYLRTLSGSFYIIFDNLLTGYTGTGNIIDLADPTKWSLRYDGDVGPSGKHELAEAFLLGVDINNNGLTDIVTGSGHAGIGSSNRSGELIIIYDSLINNNLSTGVSLDIASTATYNLRFYDASNSYFSINTAIETKDINGNGKKDIVIGSGFNDKNSRTDSGSVYVLYDSILERYTGVGNQIDLTNFNNFNIRIDGAAASHYLSNDALAISDMDQNGIPDILIGASAGYRSRAGSGSLYVFYDTLIDNYLGVGNTINLANPNTYSFRLDGGYAGSSFANGLSEMRDFDSNGTIDYVIPAFGENANSLANSGSVYVIYNEALNYQSNIGTTVDMLTVSPSARYDGAYEYGFLSAVVYQNDLNNDQKHDLFFMAPGAAPDGRTIGGSYYLVLNFPHTITADTVPASVGTTLFTGTVGATLSVTNISGVQYQIGSSSPGGSWQECSASDGSFDEKNESFKCQISGLANGSDYVIYFRSYDDNTSYTPASGYTSASFTFDTASPTANTVSASASSIGASITWTTQEASSSQIYYGLTPISLGSSTPVTDTSPYTTSHTVSLSSLVPCTFYYYQTVSVDQASNRSIGDSNSFITAGCPGNSEVNTAYIANRNVSFSVGDTVSLITSVGSTLNLSLPPGFTSQDATLQLKPLNHTSVSAALGSPSSDYLSSHLVFDLEALPGVGDTISSFDQPLTLSIHYTYAEISGIDDGTMVIYRHDGSSWYPLTDSRVDKQQLIITATTTHFSAFMVFGRADSDSTRSSSSPSVSTPSAPSCDDPPPSSIPNLFQIDTTSNTAKLFFTPISNTSEFFVSFSSINPAGEEHGEKMVLLREGVQSHTVYFLKPNTVYYFKVRGQNGCMPGGWSNILKAKTTNSKNRITKYYSGSTISQAVSKSFVFPILNSVVSKDDKLVLPTPPNSVSLTPTPAKLITPPSTTFPTQSPLLTSTPAPRRKFCIFSWCFF